MCLIDWVRKLVVKCDIVFKTLKNVFLMFLNAKMFIFHYIVILYHILSLNITIMWLMINWNFIVVLNLIEMSMLL